MDGKILRGCPLFELLRAEQLAKVADLAEPRQAAGGSFLFREGDPGDAMYVLLEGKVRISKRVEGIGEEALAILEPGAFFGEMALIDDSPRSADARAHTDCRLAAIRREALEELTFVDRDLAHDLLWAFCRTLSARLRETNDKIRGFFALSAFR
jgi:CRP/FNR family transcriptional regulator, cyclic AMP receptor protein